MPTIQEYMAEYAAQNKAADNTGFVSPDWSSRTPAAPAKPVTKDPSILRRAGDFGVDVLKAVPSLVEAGAGLAGMVPGVHYIADPLGEVAANVTRGLGEQLYSGKRLEEEQAIAQRMQAVQDESLGTQAKTAVGAYVDNPYALLGMVGQSLGLAKGGAILGKKALEAVGKPIRAADGAIDVGRAATAAQVGEGLVAGGLVASTAAQENPEEFAARYWGLPAGAATALISRGASRLMPDTADVDVLMAGGMRPAVAEGAVGLAKNVGKMAFKEGLLEESLQSGQEQMFTNLATNKPLLQGVGGAMASGAMAGGVMGGMFGFKRQKPAGDMTNDDLTGAVDQVLTPPTAEPMQEEFAQMQREVEVANQPRGEAYPALRESTTDELVRTQELLQSEQGKGVENAPEISVAITQELTRRAQQEQADAIVRQRDAEIAQAMDTASRPEFALAGETPEQAAENYARSQGAEPVVPQEPDTRTVPMFGAAGQLSPEAAIADRALRGRTIDPAAVEEATARLQAASEPARVGGQAALMAGQMPAPSPIVLAPGRPGRPAPADTAPADTAPVDTAVLKGVPPKVKTALAAAASSPQALAEAVAETFYTQAEKGSSAAYVLDRLPAIYQELTGQPLPKVRPQAQPLPQVRPQAQPLQQTATPFELQGETPQQAAENYARQQELAALATPLPDVSAPAKQAAFLTPEGEVDLIQPGLSRKESAKQTAARKFAAQQLKARQQAAAVLGQNIPEVPNAVQERVAEEVDVLQPAQVGQPVAEGVAPQAAPARKGKAEKAAIPVEQQEAQVTPAAQQAAEAVTEDEDVRDVQTSVAALETETDTKTYHNHIAYLMEVAAAPDVKPQAKAQAVQALTDLANTRGSAQDITAAKRLVKSRSKATAEWVNRTEAAKAREAQKKEAEGEVFDESAAKVVLDPVRHTKKSLEAELAHAFGEGMRRAIQSGRVKIVENQTHLVADTGNMSLRGKTTQGGYAHKRKGAAGEGVVYFVAGNIPKVQRGHAAVDIAIHEIGEHAGMERMMGARNYRKLLSSIRQSMAKRVPVTQFDKDVAAAKAKLLEDQQGSAHEVLAYMVQHTPDSSGLDQMWSSLKAFAVSVGLWTDSSLDKATLRALARGATAKWLKAASRKPVTAQAGVTVAQSGIASDDTQEVLGGFSSVADRAQQTLKAVTDLKPEGWMNMTLKAFKGAIPWMTKHHLVKTFDAKWFNGALAKNALADAIHEATAARINQMFNKPYHQFEELERKDMKRASAVAKLMGATEFKIDPNKTWAQHTHLHNLPDADKATAERYLNDYRQVHGRMLPEDKKLYADLAKMNEALYTMELAVATYNMVHASPSEVKSQALFKTDPTDTFRKSTTAHSTIADTQNYWKGVLEQYTSALDTYTSAQRGALPTQAATDPEIVAAEREMLKDVQNPKVRKQIRAQLRTHRSENLSAEQRKIVHILRPLEAQLRMVEETQAALAQAPYFHLGRFGEHFVSFRVRTGLDDRADPAAMKHVQEILAKEFPDVMIRDDATDPHIVARFENLDQAEAFRKRALSLQQQGWLMKRGAKDKDGHDQGEIQRGTQLESIAGYHTAGQNWLNRTIESIESAELDPENTKKVVSYLRSLYLDSLPDNAAIKFKQKREGRPGWHKDMVRNYAHRMRAGSAKIAAMASEPTRTQAFTDMQSAIADIRADQGADSLDVAKATAIVNEFQKRDSDQMSMPHTPKIDAWRAMNHAFFLGMSPSYVLIQGTQLGVLTWPELSKKYGFVKSAKAIAKVTATALKVMSTVIKEGAKTRGVRGAADMVITADTLKQAGLSESDADFLIQIMASGKLDIGNASREIGRVAEGVEGTKLSEGLRIASSLGYASETVTRMITALAVKQLNPRESNVAEAISTIDEAMLNYTTLNVGRMTGKKGVIWAATPVMFSFMQYQAQLLEKLYREFYSAYATKQPGESDEAHAARTKEAKKFLLGHMAAMMTLAGSLGLPFATAVAAAADKLCGVFGDGDHCDSKTALRNYTAEVFGHDIEPLLSRGLVRAAGFDVSERAGEGNILPFSKFLADKRKTEDALKDLAFSSWGAPTSMLSSMYQGAEKVLKGDLLGGMQEAVPMALKGPVKAYEMSAKGYVDKAGNVLPMEAGAWDVMLQTVGLNPGERADYQQAKFAQAQRTGVLGREATLIRNKLASAIESQDAEATKEWADRAREFDTRNPGRGILPGMAGVLRERARKRAMAEATSTTLGVSPKDFEAMKFTSFYQP